MAINYIKIIRLFNYNNALLLRLSNITRTIYDVLYFSNIIVIQLELNSEVKLVFFIPEQISSLF